MEELEGTEHHTMNDMKAVLQGEKIKGYPSLEDIEDRTEMYDIKL